MSVTCDAITCKHNDGSGSCELADIYISDAETGDPICQYAELEEFEVLEEIQEVE